MKGIRTGAWSTLRMLLAEKGITVADLHERLQVDFPVNIKSLYRLTGTGPVQRVDLEIVRAICAALKVEIGDLIRFEKPEFELTRLDPASQDELDQLMDKNNAGLLTGEEQERFNALLERVQRISLHNSKLLVDQKRRRESQHRARDGRVEAAR
jgi:DNA-binding Xre family transcriptional regulator